MLSGHWFPPHVIRFPNSALDAFYLCLVNVFLSVSIYFIVSCVLLSCMNLLYIFHMYIVFCNKRATW